MIIKPRCYRTRFSGQLVLTHIWPDRLISGTLLEKDKANNLLIPVTSISRGLACYGRETTGSCLDEPLGYKSRSTAAEDSMGSSMDIRVHLKGVREDTYGLNKIVNEITIDMPLIRPWNFTPGTPECAHITSAMNMVGCPGICRNYSLLGRWVFLPISWLESPTFPFSITQYVLCGIIAYVLWKWSLEAGI